MLSVRVFNTHRTRRVHSGAIAGYVRRVLRKKKVRNAAIGIVFVDSRRCRTMNREYLGHDYVTDVMSFPLESRPRLEGEVYVNLDRARTQATEYGVSTANEVARLVIHGTLHLIGYDDRKPADARRMKAEENRHVIFWFGQGAS
jgi:probable rRNA maturation factor